MIDLYVRNMESIWFGVASEAEKIFATSFASGEKRAMQGLLESIPFDVSFQYLEKPSVFAERVISAIKKMYDGKEAFDRFSLAMGHLSSYARKVIRIASLIPLGYVTSYGSVAKAAGGSPRSVGHVMHINPFAPIVPCHRVVSSDFTLGGYGGGLDAKLDFLQRERQGYATKREISVNGKNLEVFPVEFVLRKLKKE